MAAHLNFMKHTKKGKKEYEENYYIKLNTVKETLVGNLNKILNFNFLEKIIFYIKLYMGKSLYLKSNKC